ncbi:MAG: hypothetical protein B7Y39_18660 [Bdellovibrio sp. 28-41-41]|nr:MAG: hypothetical protein B7Y39_18660 [Bdellovibrio sp. 28-41-41]
MKKNFSLTSPKHKPDRQVELVKAEVNKYVARERRKALPEGVDFWDFDCKCGATAETAIVLHVDAINKNIDEVAATKAESVYVEILAKPGVRKKKV